MITIYIYKITNLINDKVYIGQTRDTLSQRWSNHKSVSRRGFEYALSNAIRKYGEDNFKIEIIEECSRDRLNEKEIYWIEHYNSTDRKYGYNIVLGGQANQRTSDPLYGKIDEIIDLIKNTNMSLKDIGMKYGVKRNTISSMNTGKTWFRSDLEYPIRNIEYRRTCKNHTCKNCNTKIQSKSLLCIKCYLKVKSIKRPDKETLNKLMIENNYNKKLVGNLCGVSDNAVRKWCIKYNLKFTKDKPIRFKNPKNIPKPVIMIKDNIKIRYFPSIKEAAKITGIQASHIGQVVSNKRKTAGGYKWESNKFES